MSDPTTIDPVSFANTLDSSVVVYDSYSEQDNKNYFGTLRPLVTVPGNSTASVQPIHDLSVLIISDATTNIPLARLISSSLFSTVPFGVGQADVKAMARTMQFITLITQHPDDPVAKPFLALWGGSTPPQVTVVNQFFKQHLTYSSCTYATYMMGSTYMAELQVSKGKPLDQVMYSLSSLVKMLGGHWPVDIPDIVVTKFTCNTKGGVLAIRAEVELDKLPAPSDEALKFFGSLFKVKSLQVAVDVKYGLSMGWLGTRLAIGLDAMHIPCGGSTTLTITKPTVTIDITPLFKFIVFTVTGGIPFNIFGKAFEVDVSMVIDKVEANFGVVIKGDNSSLPAPPVMKGVHFDKFGVGIGVLFEPLGVAIGLTGNLHIGEPDGFQVVLDDDTFAVVCQLEAGVPNPLYISFYVPQMHLTDVLTVFTDAKSDLEVPVSFTNLSFRWSENPMLPVALPDGSLSTMGYGFSAAANILAFSFYGDIDVNLTNGLTADIEMGPLALGNVFSLGGDGPGVSIKVDASGSPIRNNQLATTVLQQQAIKSATTKQLVPPGGPVLKLQTSASPFLVLNGHVSLFEVDHASLNAVINASGITFQVDFGLLLSTRMSCTLSDWHNLTATFQYIINQTVQLPSIDGVSLGSMPLRAFVSAHLSLSTSTSDLVIRVGGGFYFAGMHRNFGDFTADAHIQKVSDLLSAIFDYIESEASQIFGDLLNTGAAWAGKVKQGFIMAVDTVADVLHTAFGQDADEIASTMSAAGFGVNEITGQLKNIFDPSQVANALKTGLNMSELGVATAMQQAGYDGEAAAEALEDTFGSDAGQIATALRGAYGWSVDQIHNVLGDIGFTASDIGNAFQSLGGDFASVGTSILNSLNPFKWGHDPDSPVAGAIIIPPVQAIITRHSR